MQKATCKHCRTEQFVSTFTGQARFLNHRNEAVNAPCPGSMELATEAAINYEGPTVLETSKTAVAVRMDRIAEKARRKAEQRTPPAEPSFHDKQEHDDWEEFGW